MGGLNESDRYKNTSIYTTWLNLPLCRKQINFEVENHFYRDDHLDTWGKRKRNKERQCITLSCNMCPPTPPHDCVWATLSDYVC